MRKKGLLGVFVVGVLAIIGFTLVKQWGEGAVVVLGPPGGAVRVTIDGRDLGTVQPGAWRRYAVRLGRHEVRIEGVRRTAEPATEASRRRDPNGRRGAPPGGDATESPPQKVSYEVTLDSDFAHLGVPALKEQCFTELELTLKPDGTRTPKVVSRTRASAPWPIPTTDLLSETELPRSVTEDRRFTVLATLACDAMGSDETVLASLGHAMAAPPPPEPPQPKEPAAGGLTAAEAAPEPVADAGVATPQEPEPAPVPTPDRMPEARPATPPAPEPTPETRPATPPEPAEAKPVTAPEPPAAKPVTPPEPPEAKPATPPGPAPEPQPGPAPAVESPRGEPPTSP